MITAALAHRTPLGEAVVETLREAVTRIAALVTHVSRTEGLVDAARRAS
jgi:hypothetical protein